MDQIFDRLGNLLRSLFQDGDEERPRNSRRTSGDADFDTAWDELDEFLKTGKSSSSAGSQQSYRRTSSSGYRYTGSAGSSLPEEIRRDYANLEVPIGADMATVRKAYHRLIRQYHPDRFAGNPQKLKDATEITQRINQSYQRIKQFHDTRKM